MSTESRQSLSKTVEMKAVDDERQIAVGGVLVPNKVDLQGDFVRPETIQALADDFMRRLQTGGDAEGGVMHAAFPGSDDVTLAENDVLDEARTVGGKTFPAGTWLQSWKFHDDRLWRLVKSGTLAGYSIGAREVLAKEYSPDSVPAGVVVPDYHSDGEPVEEIVGGKIVEVSSVDIPAVPDAQMVSLKSADDLAKAQDALTEGMEACVTVLQDRGHGETEATELCTYLQDNTKMTDDPDGDDAGGETPEKDVDEDAGSDGGPEKSADEAGLFARVGRAVFGGEKSAEEAVEAAEAEAEKAGRVLSKANRERAMTIHDEALAMVKSSSQVDTSDYQAFADDPSVSYDGSGTSSKQTNSTEPDMSDKNEDEPPEWAKSLIDDVEELKNDIAEEKTETEPEEGEEKSTDGEEEEMPEWAKSLQEDINETKSDLDDLAEARGKSQQIGGEGDETEADGWEKTFGIPGDA
ncbi:XkdF-like putative serine protease domain-containing protein [Halocalculus aciditolerans]|uniref:Phage-like element PBSX protein XkdF domain-containing protein n=1 Tax=Halocalculus aciditolerans TaxID=1383812 RepID=A0A830FA78_9EURY|nr:XkdF-like putative serine protease domain-containing protein [Halocalculus aciditolerans]GGL55103.1 hypothetical protein GCM10009039_11510 [Halocalculus aciditolerans]